MEHLQTEAAKIKQDGNGRTRKEQHWYVTAATSSHGSCGRPRMPQSFLGRVVSPKSEHKDGPANQIKHALSIIT